MFSLIYAWMNGWVNNHEAGNLIRHCAQYDVILIHIYCLKVVRREKCMGSLTFPSRYLDIQPLEAIVIVHVIFRDLLIQGLHVQNEKKTLRLFHYSTACFWRGVHWTSFPVKIKALYHSSKLICEYYVCKQCDNDIPNLARRMALFCKWHHMTWFGLKAY